MIDLYKMKIANEKAELVYAVLDEIEKVLVLTHGITQQIDTQKLNALYESLTMLETVLANLELINNHYRIKTDIEAFVNETKEIRDQNAATAAAIQATKDNVQSLLLQIQDQSQLVISNANSINTAYENIQSLARQTEQDNTSVTQIKTQIETLRDEVVAKVNNMPDVHKASVFVSSGVFDKSKYVELPFKLDEKKHIADQAFPILQIAMFNNELCIFSNKGVYYVYDEQAGTLNQKSYGAQNTYLLTCHQNIIWTMTDNKISKFDGTTKTDVDTPSFFASKYQHDGQSPLMTNGTTIYWKYSSQTFMTGSLEGGMTLREYPLAKTAYVGYGIVGNTYYYWGPDNVEDSGITTSIWAQNLSTKKVTSLAWSIGFNPYVGVIIGEKIFFTNVAKQETNEQVDDILFDTKTNKVTYLNTRLGISKQTGEYFYGYKDFIYYCLDVVDGSGNHKPSMTKSKPWMSGLKLLAELP